MAKTHLLAALGLATIVCGGTLVAQAPLPRTFEVTSVKVNKARDQPSFGNSLQHGGLVAITNTSLFQLLASVFSMDLNRAGRQIIGLPAWANSDGFDIQAEAPGDPSVAEKREMMLGLLADRFKMTFHHETRPLPIFALALASPGKPGPQLRAHTDDTPCISPTQPRGVDLPGAGAALRPDSATDAAWAALASQPCGRVLGGILANRRDMAWSGGRRITMDMLADSLGNMSPMDRPVYGDRSGLTGTFDFAIVWNPQIQELAANPVDALGLTFVQALREQLGLKLDAQTAPVDVIVVDHVEHPAEN